MGETPIYIKQNSNLKRHPSTDQMDFKELSVPINVAKELLPERNDRTERPRPLVFNRGDSEMVCEDLKQDHFPKSQKLPKEHLKCCW